MQILANPSGDAARLAALRAARTALAAASLVLAAGWTPARAQDVIQEKSTPEARVYPVNPEVAPRPAVRAVRAAAPITVDGRLDEPAWAAAEPVTDFVQQAPRTGYAASLRTVARVLFDSTHIYVGATLYDPEPDKIIIAGLEHDFDTGGGDMFGVSLDTFLDRRNSFLFMVNPGGALRDEQTFNDSRNVVVAWEGVAHLRTAITDSAWVVELAIPLTTLRFDPSKRDQSWGMNMFRRIRRLNETSYWAPLDRQHVIHRMSRAGTLHGLDGLRQGRNLTVKPYVLAGRSTGAQVPASAAGSKYDAGLDLKYGLTSGLTLDATYRTDFSQVEVDQQQVNLTRFSLFFPERREFFIENGGSFSFADVAERNYRMGSSPSEFTLFHSRRIGLTDDGRPIPILGGSRLTGRVGDYEVGLMTMQTESTTGTPAENFAVARLRRNLFGRSDVGLIVINRQATGAGGGAYNRSFGADANIRLFGNMIVNSYLAGTEGTGEASDGMAGRLSVAWRNRFWNTSVLAKQVGESFDPGVGFVRRTAMRHFYGTVGVHPRPRIARVQEVNPYVEMDYITDLSSVLETRQATAGTRVSFTNGSAVEVEVNDQFERLRDPFRVFPGVTIPVGDYGFRSVSLGYDANQNRRLTASVRVSGGDFYDGTRRTASATMRWRPRHDLFISATGERNDIDLPGGAFQADLFGIQSRYALSTKFLTSAFVQYEARSAQLVTNVRLDFRHAPLSDVFLVYTERRNTDTSQRLERSLALKVTRLLAF